MSPRVAFVLALAASAVLSASETSAQSSRDESAWKSALKDSANAHTWPMPDDFVALNKEPSLDLEELRQRMTYPPEARENGIEGRVIVRVLVDTAGHPVTYVVDYVDNKMFVSSAVEAIMAMKFSPGISLTGEPVYAWMTVPVSFRLG